jgi:cell division protein FtsL
MRGLAVVVMIECHTFNSLVRGDLRDGGPYVMSQFVGGMAAPLFLFMAGMTLAFQMDSLERRQIAPLRRWWISLRRAAYIFAIAMLFRLTNFLATLPTVNWKDLTKVDILNCMALAMLVFSAAAFADSNHRARYALLGALAVIALAPVMCNLSWNGAPSLLKEYLVQVPGRGRFAFFPCGSYIGFGLAVGTVVKHTAEERFERLMQWSVLIGFALIFSAQYLSNIPYSIYEKSDFWTNSPTLILIRVGISLLMMSGGFLWTQYCAMPTWSWMETLGKNSLMVYWVHVMLVYGTLAQLWKRNLSIGWTMFGTLFVIALMTGLSVLWMRWKSRRAASTKARESGGRRPGIALSSAG